VARDLDMLSYEAGGFGMKAVQFGLLVVLLTMLIR
jgi:hypothetical protein